MVGQEPDLLFTGHSWNFVARGYVVFFSFADAHFPLQEFDGVATLNEK
jgi:hypothetical protein